MPFSLIMSFPPACLLPMGPGVGVEQRWSKRLCKTPSLQNLQSGGGEKTGGNATYCLGYRVVLVAMVHSAGLSWAWLGLQDLEKSLAFLKMKGWWRTCLVRQAKMVTCSLYSSQPIQVCSTNVMVNSQGARVHPLWIMERANTQVSAPFL